MPQPIRCLTWNVRLGIQEGVPALADVVRSLRPDLVALQEVGCRWTMGPPGDTTAELSAATGLPHARHVTAIETEEGARYGQALLTRWPLERAKVLDLPRRRDEPRKALSATVSTPDGPLHVVATHLSHLADERPVQGEALALHVAGLLGGSAAAPLILMGDLNEPGSPAWLAQLRSDLADADAARARPTYPAHEPVERLDYLLAHGGRWARARVLDEAAASDHRGLFALFVAGDGAV